MSYLDIGIKAAVTVLLILVYLRARLANTLIREQQELIDAYRIREEALTDSRDAAVSASREMLRDMRELRAKLEDRS